LDNYAGQAMYVKTGFEYIGTHWNLEPPENKHYDMAIANLAEFLASSTFPTYFPGFALTPPPDFPTVACDLDPRGRDLPSLMTSSPFVDPPPQVTSRVSKS
jgi:hypothetical protein